MKLKDGELDVRVGTQVYSNELIYTYKDKNCEKEESFIRKIKNLSRKIFKMGVPIGRIAVVTIDNVSRDHDGFEEVYVGGDLIKKHLVPCETIHVVELLHQVGYIEIILLKKFLGISITEEDNAICYLKFYMRLSDPIKFLSNFPTFNSRELKENLDDAVKKEIEGIVSKIILSNPINFWSNPDETSIPERLLIELNEHLIHWGLLISTNFLFNRNYPENFENLLSEFRMLEKEFKHSFSEKYFKELISIKRDSEIYGDGAGLYIFLHQDYDMSLEIIEEINKQMIGTCPMIRKYFLELKGSAAEDIEMTYKVLLDGFRRKFL